MTAPGEQDFLLQVDPREEKLPQWVRAQLGQLRRELRALRADTSRMELRMADHVAAEKDSDTVLTDPLGGLNEIPDRPLGSGAHVRFADFYEVHYGDAGSGLQALIIETDYPLQVRPVNADSVIVARA